MFRAGGVAELLELVGDLTEGADELGVYPVGDQLTVGGGPGMHSRLLLGVGNAIAPAPERMLPTHGA